MTSCDNVLACHNYKIVYFILCILWLHHKIYIIIIMKKNHHLTLVITGKNIFDSETFYFII